MIPPNLAYGTAGSGPIGPNATLLFVVDLIALPTYTASPTPVSTNDTTEQSSGIDISNLPNGQTGTPAFKIGVSEATSYIQSGALNRAMVGNLGGITESCKFILETFMALNGGKSSQQQYADFMLGCETIVKAWY